MGKRRSPRPPGRPKKIIDPDMQKTLLGGIELGVPVSIACQGAGIAESSFYGWMQRGYAEHEERANDVDGQPDEDEQPYLDLFLAVQQARTKAATRNVGIIQKVASGGTVTEETTRKYRDPETGELVEEKTVKRQAPDWRAAAWYLERSHKGEFAKGAEQVEVTGANGGPIEVTANAQDLARRLDDHLAAGVASVAAIESGSSHGDDDDDDT